jgi:hypothetical protein
LKQVFRLVHGVAGREHDLVHLSSEDLPNAPLDGIRVPKDNNLDLPPSVRTDSTAHSLVQPHRIPGQIDVNKAVAAFLEINPQVSLWGNWEPGA